MTVQKYSAEALGRVIKQQRRAKGLTQSALAKLAGYTGNAANITISNIENGKALPDSDRLPKFAKALGFSTPELKRLATKEQAKIDADGSHRGLSVQSVRAAFVGSKHIDNERREGRLASEVDALREEHKAQVDSLRVAIDRARDKFLLPFFVQAQRIDGFQLESLDPLPLPTGEGAVKVDLAIASASVRKNVVEMLGTSAAASGAGAVAGTAAAMGTYAAVGALATASTGTAIAGLSGAAATSATLAWLGGGSLAVGGLGVAGGTAVLTGILALPAAVAFGAALIYKGRKIRQQSAEEAKALDAAEKDLHTTRKILEEAWLWAGQGVEVMINATVEGAARLGQLTALMPPVSDPQTGRPRVALADLRPPGRALVDQCIDLATVILSVQALPIWSRVASASDQVALQESEMKRWREWNDQSLQAARVQVEAIGATALT